MDNSRVTEQQGDTLNTYRFGPSSIELIAWRNQSNGAECTYDNPVVLVGSLDVGSRVSSKSRCTVAGPVPIESTIEQTIVVTGHGVRRVDNEELAVLKIDRKTRRVNSTPGTKDFVVEQTVSEEFALSLGVPAFTSGEATFHKGDRSSSSTATKTLTSFPR